MGLQLTVTAGITVRQSSMGRGDFLVDGQVLPFIHVIMGNSRIVGSIGCVASLLGNDGHGLDTNHPLEGQVGLVANHIG